MFPLNVLVFVLGALLVVRAILSAVRTFVLPRASNDAVSRTVFRLTRRVFHVIAGSSKPYETRDRFMAYFGPISLIVLPAAWLVLVLVGYAALFWAIGVQSAYDAFAASGSSLLTLGFVRPAVPGADVLAFSEAVIGLGLVALLVSYLPTIYGAFSRRELLVSLLEVRADSPPSPLVLITRFHRLRGLEHLHEMWERWEQWFAEIEETHTSLTVLVDYRSQQADHSWVNAAGAMMDAAAIVRSSVNVPMDVQADLMIRAGYLALRRISRIFGIRYELNPTPDTPTSVDRSKFDRAIDVLVGAGVPVVADRDQAWRDFNGWRVNYDQVLRGLERMTVAPTPWWDRPMRSAWATDEPLAEVAAAHGEGGATHAEVAAAPGTDASAAPSVARLAPPVARLAPPVVRLAPMAKDAFDRWRERTVREYAAEHVAAGNWPAEGSPERSDEEFADLLPDGLATADQTLWTLVDDTGRDVGALWVGPRPGRPGALYIWDFAVKPEARGRGIGRAALDALDTWARGAGYDRIGLHVFGANDVARRLYARAGYVETDLMMEKRLFGGPA